MVRRTSMMTIGLLALALLLTTIPVGTAAAQGRRCFPETNQCISDSIRTYWEKNGGLSIFGFPITDQHQETVEGRTIQVQWFERDRLEIQADGMVTAGRLGVELLEKQGRPWQQGNKLSPDLGCLGNYPTGYQICGTFARYWQKNGGLSRLGYPITGEIQETIQGQVYNVQYFERRRFELHGDQVLLGLLGREVHDFSQSVDVCTQVPESISAYVEPSCGPVGTVFAAIGGGFKADENVGVYATAPDQTVIGAPFQVKADGKGTTSVVTFATDSGYPTGIYAISFEGVKSHHKAIAYFRVK
ncbi:MAG: hypothetical protein WCI67_04125 [Chloroflexales bacterium]